MASTPDSSRLDSLLSHLEGTLSLDEVAQRHGVEVSEVASWKTLYLRGARSRPRSSRVLASSALVVAASLVALTAFAQSTLCSSGWPTQLICFADDSPARAHEVNTNFKKVWEGTVPVGTIVAWHKTLATTTLPSSWVECSGQTINDTASPYNNLTIPDLNGSGRFLRGSTSSGALQDDAFQGHKHALNPGQTIHLLNYVHPMGSLELFGADQRACTGAGGCSSGYYDMYNITSPSIDNSPSEGAHGAPRFATETRPRNMSVVWVMRIK
ncbi:MAG: hypothetical protein Q8L14_28590 [Myxococcales bacterium]|nr:hypothetical protein [Myxococcales bacterium]